MCIQLVLTVEKGVMMSLLKATKASSKVRYRLVKMPARQDEKAWYAAHAIVQTTSLRQIAEQMVREGSKYAEHEILGIAEQMIDVITERLRDGHSVNFGSMMRFRPSIKGRFETQDEAFDPKKHQLRVAVSVGRRLLKAVEDVTVECVDEKKMPEILDVSATPYGDSHFIEITGLHLYQKHLGDGANWSIRTADAHYPIKEVVQKTSGRLVTFLFPQATLPHGTEVTLVLTVGKSEFSSNPILL